MKKIILRTVYIALAVTLYACTHEPVGPEITIDASDFSATIDENPADDAIIGKIDASTNTGVITFEITAQNPEGALAINTLNGELRVNNPIQFDFETNPTITGEVTITNEDQSSKVSVNITLNDVVDENTSSAFTVWNGPTITFNKADGADPDMQSSQDRLTDNVWITRSNDGGQIYNIRDESSASKNSSPTGTEWAIGTIDQVENLTFAPFRSAVFPKEVVGKDLVMHLIEDDIYVSVTFTSWSQDRKGGFSYERSTE